MSTRFALSVVLAGFVVLAAPSVAIADDDMMMGPQGGSGGGGMQGMGGMQSAPADSQAAQADAHARMQRLREHTRAMDGVHDPNQLMMEMRIHMRMTDDMIESLMAGGSAHSGGAQGGCGGSTTQQPMQME